MVSSESRNRREDVCRLCGLPLGGNRVEYSGESGPLHFCCHGCQQVFLLLSAASGVLPQDFRETELYRLCVEWGIISTPSSSPEMPPPSHEGAVPPLQLSFGVDGMWCPSCAWLIEQVLGRTPGVVTPRVLFASDRLHLTYLPHVVSPAEIVARIGRLGYRLTGLGDEPASRVRGSALPLGVSALLTANIMMTSVVFYGLVDLPQTIIRGVSYPVLVMASFVLFYAGLPILKRGFASLLYGSPSMDTLISFGALSAYLYSIVQMIVGGPHLYFDTASMLVTFVLFGRYIETRARQNIRAGMPDLYEIVRDKVRSVRGTWVRADSIEPGELFTVAAGERVPADSRVVAGNVTMDESFLTGESMPRLKGPGDSVLGGSAVRNGEATLEASRTAAESLVGQMVVTIEEALEKKDGYERLADRISSLFVPVVMAVAIATSLGVWLSGSSVREALLRGLTVLLISCPCALGIAIPLVKVAVIGLARRLGVLVREPEALERMHTIDTVVLDKTGTLTEGNFSLQAVIGRQNDEKALFSRLASVEVHSPHFIGRRLSAKRTREAPG